AIETALEEKYDKKPFIVASNIARTKVDQNRGINRGACGNKLAKRAWQAFHEGISKALNIAVKKYGYVLYIDLHGHGGSTQKLYLGYAITDVQLKKVYNNIDVSAIAGISSIANMLDLDPKLKFRNLIMGDHSFGTLMGSAGYPSIPSVKSPYPLPDEGYFSGGYNTRRYTSDKHSKVYGWQVECYYNGVRDTPQDRKKFGEAFTKVYKKFIKG